MTKFNVQNELLDRAKLSKQLGDYKGAEKLIKRAIVLAKEENQDHITVTRYLVRELANVHVKSGSLKKAENVWKSLLKEQRSIEDPNQLELSKTMVQLALFYGSQEKWRQAKIRYGQALKIQEPLLSKEIPDYVLTLSEYAKLLALTGKRRKAENLFCDAVKLAETRLGDWDEYVALVLRRKALAFKNIQNPELLEPYLERAVAILADDSATPHPELSKSLAELADLSMERGFVRRAEKLYVKSFQLAEAILGSKHRDSISILVRLADLRRVTGKYEEAEAHYRKILTVKKQVNNRRSLEVALSLVDLGSLLKEMGKHDQAEPLLIEALDIQEALLGKEHVELAKTLYELACLHQEQRQYSLAENEYQRALSIRESNKNKAPTAVADALTGLAFIHCARKQHQPAETLLLKALSIKEEAFGKESPKLVSTLNKLGIFYESLHNMDLALEYYQRANLLAGQEHGFFCRLWLDYED